MRIFVISTVFFLLCRAVLADGDPVRGKAQSGACVGCHQEDGEGRDNSGSDAWPRLAGMNADYLSAQLAAYKSGARKSASMKTFSMMMNEEKMADIAAYYASLPPVAPTPAVPADDGLLARGKALATTGDTARGIPPCTQCHGADNRGDGKVPGITAQPASYLRAQVIAWQRGDRPDDSADEKGMFPIARRLNAEDSAAVAAWLASQAP